MPIGEAIIGIIGESIGYLVVEVIIKGSYELILSVYYGIRKLITGKERETHELKRVKKYYLHKKFRLKSDFNGRILNGTWGTVLEIIDEQNFYVEFEDFNGKRISEGNKQIFKIDRKRITLERKKRRHRAV